MSKPTFVFLLLAFGLLAAAPSAPARAGKERIPPVANAAYKKECGDCHMAFQPRFLSPSSWRNVMNGLADHFGESATLPEATRAEILDYLLANAGGGKRVYDGGAGTTRITDLAWWQKEHAPRKIAPEVWARPGVGSKANCAACHSGAERGDYDEHAARIPPR